MRRFAAGDIDGWRNNDGDALRKLKLRCAAMVRFYQWRRPSAFPDYETFRNEVASWITDVLVYVHLHEAATPDDVESVLKDLDGELNTRSQREQRHASYMVAVADIVSIPAPARQRIEDILEADARVLLVKTLYFRAFSDLPRVARSEVFQFVRQFWRRLHIFQLACASAKHGEAPPTFKEPPLPGPSNMRTLRRRLLAAVDDFLRDPEVPVNLVTDLRKIYAELSARRKSGERRDVDALRAFAELLTPHSPDP